MTRENENTPSERFYHAFDDFQSYPKKGYDTFFNKVVKKIKELIVYCTKKPIIFLSLIAVFSWFNVHNEKLVTGLTNLAMGDLNGFSLIFDISGIKNNFKEAKKIAIGVDPKWKDFKKKTGKEISEDFTYVGDGISITKDLVVIGKVTKDCTKKVCNSPITYVSNEEMSEICDDLYSGKLPSWNILNSAMNKRGPIVKARINKMKEFVEWTSNRNPNDSDDYKLFFKNKNQEKALSEYVEDGYLDEDEGLQHNIGFRCYIQL